MIERKLLFRWRVALKRAVVFQSLNWGETYVPHVPSLPLTPLVQGVGWTRWVAPEWSFDRVKAAAAGGGRSGGRGLGRRSYS